MTELLKIEDLTVSFGTSAGRVKALNNVSLSLDEGEVYCVVGESGSGKSTLALSVMGLLPHNAEVSDGRIMYKDLDLLRAGQPVTRGTLQTVFTYQPYDETRRLGVRLETESGVVGWGEGGLIALYAAAADTRIDAACVSGYFDSRQDIWREPIDRNVFGLLEQFGDAELASLIAPRALIIDAARGPEATIPGGRGAPAADAHGR